MISVSVRSQWDDVFTLVNVPAERPESASKSLPALSESFSERIPLHLGLEEKKKVMNLKVSMKFLTSGTLLLLATMAKFRQ